MLAAGSWELKDKRMPRPRQSVTPSQSRHSTRNEMLPALLCFPFRSSEPDPRQPTTRSCGGLAGQTAGSTGHGGWSFPLPGERSLGALPACLPPALLPAVLLARRLGVRPPLVPSCLVWGRGHTHTHMSEGPGGTRLAPCFVSIRG